MAGITDWKKVEQRQEVEDLIIREIESYQNKMADFLGESIIPPSSLELRSKHAQLKMEAVDSYRKNSIGRPIGVWKLERELARKFEETVYMTKRVRRESFQDAIKFPRVTSLVN